MVAVRPRSTGVVLAVALVATTTASRAQPIVLDGEVPPGGPEHFFLDFDVPAGIQEIEVRHDDQSPMNILDFGLDDPNGYRGWGGGTTDPTIVNTLNASPGYPPGPIVAGRWRVVVGKAKIVASPARYHVEIDLRAAPTLAPVPRAPYTPPPARKTETRYYAGDFHVHSRESTDATATIDQDIDLAKRRGLDFIELSDHNTLTQLDFYAAAHTKYPDFLLLPGIEYTTYAGHGNAIGATKWVDHKIGQPNVTIAGAVDAIRAQGAIVSINHPVLDLGDACIGCAWAHDVDPTKIGGVEIATLGLRNGGNLFSERAIAFWDALLDKGSRAAAIGGSDDHRAGAPGGTLRAEVGSPTTLVRAKELSVAGILEGIAKGATVVKLDGPADAMVELEIATKNGGDPIGFTGDAVGARSVVLRAKVTGGDGQQIRFVKNGKPEDAVAVAGDPFVHEIVVEPPAQGEDRWRAEALVEERPRTVTSHVWLRFDGAGPAFEPASEDGCAVSRPQGFGSLLLVGMTLLAGVLRRRSRR
jgi:hypothetical protein